MYCFTPVGRGEYLFVGEQIPIKINSRNLPQIVGRTADAALLLEQGSGRLAGRGLAGVFPQGGSGLRLVGLGCVMAPGAGAGMRTVWKGSGWRLSELGATGSGAEGGAGGSGEGGKAAR